MAYIGKTPVVGNFQICDAISVVNGQAAYTLQVGSANVIPQSANHMIVSLNGVIQKPGSSFTVSSSTITFASNLVTGDVIDFIQILGSVLDIGTPSDGTVTESKIGSNAVTTAKITDANVTSAKMFSGFANGITDADMWRVAASLVVSGSNAVTANWERVDAGGFEKIGTALTESSGVFTFPSTGKYSIIWNIMATGSNAANYVGCGIYVTTDNSSYSAATRMYSGKSASQYTSVTSFHIFDVTNTSTHKIKLYRDSSVAVNFEGNTTETFQGLTVIRLGDT